MFEGGLERGGESFGSIRYTGFFRRRLRAEKRDFDGSMNRYIFEYIERKSYCVFIALDKRGR